MLSYENCIKESRRSSFPKSWSEFIAIIFRQIRSYFRENFQEWCFFYPEFLLSAEFEQTKKAQIVFLSMDVGCLKILCDLFYLRWKIEDSELNNKQKGKQENKQITL